MYEIDEDPVFNGKLSLPANGIQHSKSRQEKNDVKRPTTLETRLKKFELDVKEIKESNPSEQLVLRVDVIGDIFANAVKSGRRLIQSDRDALLRFSAKQLIVALVTSRYTTSELEKFSDFYKVRIVSPWYLSPKSRTVIEKIVSGEECKKFVDIYKSFVAARCTIMLSPECIMKMRKCARELYKAQNVSTSDIDQLIERFFLTDINRMGNGRAASVAVHGIEYYNDPKRISGHTFSDMSTVYPYAQFVAATVC